MFVFVAYAVVTLFAATAAVDDVGTVVGVVASCIFAAAAVAVASVVFVILVVLFVALSPVLRSALVK